MDGHQAQEDHHGPPAARMPQLGPQTRPDNQPDHDEDENRLGPELNRISGRHRGRAQRCGRPATKIIAGHQERDDERERRRGLDRRCRRPHQLLRCERDEKAGKERRVTIGEEHAHEKVDGAGGSSHDGGVDRKGRPCMNTEQAVRQAQDVWIGIRLLVVVAAGATQPAVFDAAVVTHLREPEVGQILPDALIDLLVVEDAIGSRRDGECQVPRREQPASPAAGPRA